MPSDPIQTAAVERAKKATQRALENVRAGGVPPGIVCDIGDEAWDVTDDAELFAHARRDVLMLAKALAEARQSYEAMRHLGRK